MPNKEIKKNDVVGFFRLPAVLNIVPVSKSNWWNGCKNHIYPTPVRFGRITCWKKIDIYNLVEKLSADKDTKSIPALIHGPAAAQSELRS
jgi:predicted DNA-binding transcriptional regulator AlpA